MPSARTPAPGGGGPAGPERAAAGRLPGRGGRPDGGCADFRAGPIAPGRGGAGKAEARPDGEDAWFRPTGVTAFRPDLGARTCLW
ncbi:hypothetical protein GCM10010249_14760 [Streptomyces roseolilacinus]|uniref:Uncharacterized protein n=1 Tax=Streptomyces roseolilacinus TaxID=66904 RepID=A0A918AXJ3_9ACTN|nr:hypothetical protein GCM10010249_14760 [Streptomyces roseolilacinus]